MRELLAAGEFFWLDIHDPEAADLEILREEFGFHPLSLEDSWRFGQRPKIDDYDGYVFLVVFGASSEDDDDGLVEVHCFYSDRYLSRCTATRRRRSRRSASATSSGTRRSTIRRGCMHAVVDGLVDSFFPRLAAIDDRIDVLEDGIFRDAGDAQLQEIFSMKRALVGMRKVISPQRDLFASIVVGVEAFPGMTDDDQRYFRDVYDHLIRIGDMVDTYRDLLTGAMDVYLSTVSNRLNGVMKQLAIIATVFMPLTFLTGLLRAEPRLDGRARRRARPLPRLRDRARAADPRDRARLLLPPRLAQPVSPRPPVPLGVGRHRDARPEIGRGNRAGALGR